MCCLLMLDLPLALPRPTGTRSPGEFLDVTEMNSTDDEIYVDQLM